MVDLNPLKITVYQGINDVPTQSTTQQGANGAWATNSINNIIDEVETLKAAPTGGALPQAIYHNGVDIPQDQDTTVYTNDQHLIRLVKARFNLGNPFFEPVFNIAGSPISYNPVDPSEVTFSDIFLLKDQVLEVNWTLSAGAPPIPDPVTFTLIIFYQPMTEAEIDTNVLGL